MTRLPRAASAIASAIATLLSLSLSMATTEAKAGPLLRIPLENFDQMQFFGLVRVGSPPQSFHVIFDTGSSDVWLPAADCGVCAGERRYDARASATHEPLTERFHLEYGSGNASGAVMRERLLLGADTDADADADADAALELSGVRMGSVTATTKRLQRFQADGIVGLGLETLALITRPSLFRSASAAGGRGGPSERLLARFSMYINPLPGALPASQLIFGGVDESLPLAAAGGEEAAGSRRAAAPASASVVTWHRFPVVPYPSGSAALGFWAIRMTQLTVGERAPPSASGSAASSRLRRSSLPLAPRTRAGEELGDAGDDPEEREDEDEDEPPVAIVDARAGGRRDAVAIVDSGTSLLLLPRGMLDRVLAALGRHLQVRHGVQLRPHARAVSGVACWACAPEQFPPLTFAFASEPLGPSQRLTLQGADYVRCDDGLCSPQLDVHALLPPAPSRRGAPEEVVILGVMFMRAYYTLFDVEQRAVAFACVGDAHGPCRGGRHPPLQFHSGFLGGRVRWRLDWLLWSRLYASLGVALLALAALLLWMALSTSPSEAAKALAWLTGAPRGGVRPRSVSLDAGIHAQQQQQQQGQSPAVSTPPCGVRASGDEAAEGHDASERGAGGHHSRSKPARRKSVSIDV